MASRTQGGGKRENHIETPSLFIHPLVDTVSLSSGIPSVYSRKSRTRSIRDGELPSTSTSPSSTPDHELTAVPLQQSYLWGRPGQGARQQRASRCSNLAASSPVASCSHPGPGPSAVPSSPVSSPASIIRWRETATREVLLLLFRRIEIPRRASWINPMPGWVVGISLNSPHWHARVARRPGPSRRGRKYRGKLQSRLGCRSSWSPCRASFFPFPSLLSPPKSKRNTQTPHQKKNSEGNTQPTTPSRRKQARRFLHASKRPHIHASYQSPPQHPVQFSPLTRQRLVSRPQPRRIHQTQHRTKEASSAPLDPAKHSIPSQRPVYRCWVGGKSPLGRIM